MMALQETDKDSQRILLSLLLYQNCCYIGGKDLLKDGEFSILSSQKSTSPLDSTIFIKGASIFLVTLIPILSYTQMVHRIL